MFKKNRSIRTFVIHKLIQSFGTFIPVSKRVQYTEFKKHYGINKTNKCIGYTPDYIGPSPSKIVDKKNYVIDFLKNKFTDLKELLSSSCYNDLIRSINEERVVYSAGFTTCGKHLKEYFKDNTTEDLWSVHKIIDILDKSKFKWFRSSVCSFRDGSEIYTNVKMNPESFSGHYTSMLFGRKKSASDIASRNIAHNFWDLMHTTVVKNFYLWTILGREKDIKINKKVEEEVGTRVVMTTEHPMTLLLCWFAQKISYIVTNTFHWDCKFNIDGEFTNEKYSRLIEKESNYDFILEADWTFYDSNIDTNFLVVATLLICAGMPNDQLHRNIRYLIVSSVVTKFVIVPPGVVVRLQRAQPSGHPFGTLVNCYVNLIYWSLIGYQIYGDAYASMMDVEVYGDDTRAYFKYHKNLSKIDEYVEKCGLKSDPLINNIRSVGEQCDDDKNIDYLKRRFDTKGIRWNHKKMFDKMLYPSKNRDINDQLLMVSSWYETVPTDNDARIFMTEFARHINNKYNNEISYDTRRQIKLILDHDGHISKNNYKFHYYNRNYNINKDYNDEIKRLSGSIVFRSDEYYHNYDPYELYSDHTKILAYIGISGGRKISKIEYEVGVLGRDPPKNLEYDKRIVDVRENIDKFSKAMIRIAAGKFRKVRYLSE